MVFIKIATFAMLLITEAFAWETFASFLINFRKSKNFKFLTKKMSHTFKTGVLHRIVINNATTSLWCSSSSSSTPDLFEINLKEVLISGDVNGSSTQRMLLLDLISFYLYVLCKCMSDLRGKFAESKD